MTSSTRTSSGASSDLHGKLLNSAHRISHREAQLVLSRGQSGVDPALPAAVHRFHIVVAHLLQIIGYQRGAEAASAIQDQLRAGIRDALLDVPLDDALAQVHGIGNMSLGPFVFLGKFNQQNSSAGFMRRLTSGTFVSLTRFFASWT